MIRSFWLGFTSAKRSVRYEVRSEGGVMTYDTLLHVEQAYMAGWIAPEDEIRQIEPLMTIVGGKILYQRK